MAGSSPRSTGGAKKARIEIIPLIDVIFFLLATFVLFTLSLNKSQGLHVALPSSETGEPRDPSGSATITVTSEGTMAWDKDPITLDEFLTRLKAFHIEHPDDARILINGDTEASFSSVIYVFDEVRKVGIQKVLIETQAKSPSS
ncbi:MAG TPA: biopolymer transporter ExbD [Opitutaceae bacterium]|jgi:biopolymer transport protein ExbD|nr:biopolymer transporter ExbD [Opitutaceae bacterium]